MQTYYEILNVDISSSSEEIKRAFRKRAKELHPDVNPFHESDSEAMQGLLDAYETLMDPRRREDYNRRNFIIAPEVKFDYRDFLKRHPDDESCQAQLVFFDLLHQNETEAVELYAQLSTRDGFHLLDHLGREDYMDCAFLLAEEFERQNRLGRAFGLLVEIVELEQEQPYFRHFFVEVTDRLRTLVCFKMPGQLLPSEVISYLNKLLTMDMSDKDLAFYLKKAAELYLDVGDASTASAYLQRGLELDEKLAGTKKLRDRLALYGAV